MSCLFVSGLRGKKKLKMTKEEIIEIVKQIGIGKGYRIICPEDWYGGITYRELLVNIKNIDEYIKKYFISQNNIIKCIFPEYEFLEWKFKHTTKGFWNNKYNKIFYLKWLENELGWSKPEDWYAINQDAFKKHYGMKLLEHCTIQKSIKLLYPNYNFDFHKFNTNFPYYWDDFENLRIKLLPIYHRLNRMPTQKELSKYKGLKHAVFKHGGIKKVAEKLNIQISSSYKTLSGHLVSSTYEVIIDNFLFLNNIDFDYERKIVRDKNYLYDFKVDDIFIEIWGYNSDRYKKRRLLKEKLYNENNLKLISIEGDLFIKNDLKKINEELILIMKNNNIKNKNFFLDYLKLNVFSSFNQDVIIEEMKAECLKKKFTEMPTIIWWRENGFSKHICFFERKKTQIELAIILDLQPNRKPLNYWKDWENVKNELAKLCSKPNYLPSRENLKSSGNMSIEYAILKHGGRAVVASKLGLSLKIKEKYYWRDFNNIKNELILIYNELGFFPKQKHIIKANKSSLINAANLYYGGLKKLKQIFKENNYYQNEK